MKILSVTSKILLKTEILNFPLVHYVTQVELALNILWIILDTKFHFEEINWILWNCIFTRKKKSEHHHWILHIRLLIGAKFQLKLTILTFPTEFAQKVYFRCKTENADFCVRRWLSLTILNFSALRPTSATAFQYIFSC